RKVSQKTYRLKHAFEQVPGKGEKVRKERTADAVMWRAGQTPHGARPNREGPRVRLRTCRLGASQPPGRSLEPHSNARPRGMTVLLEQSGRQNSAYRSGCHNLSYFLPPNEGASQIVTPV